MSHSSSQIKVLSLNCWQVLQRLGLKYVSKDRQPRIQAIAEVLSASDYDIVCLQELWVHADFQYIRSRVSKTLPNAKFFFSGALGSGLAILTKFPIVETSIRPYSLNGSPLDVAGGDFFVGKSIVSAVVEHPLLGETEVFNTHMYARGGDDGEEANRAHRIVGAWQFGNLIRASARRGRYVIAAGDFNSIPNSLPITIVRSHGGLVDAWMASHDSSLFPTETVFSPQLAVRDYGITCDSPLNTYSAGKPLSDVAKRFQGKRLDYVFYRQPQTPPASSGRSTSSSSPSWELLCKKSEVVLTGLVPGQSFSYSDHFGLEAILEVRHSRSVARSPPPTIDGFGVTTGLEAPTPSLRSASAIPLEDFCATELSSHSLSAALNALGIAYRRARKKATMELTGFGASLLVAVGLVAGSAWQPRPAFNPVMVLAAVALGWAGTTLLYSGFIHGNYEVNMLVNTIEEMEMLRAQRSERVSSTDSRTSSPRR
ncbi:phospholipase C type enzyme [Tulasnella sp. 425]|nr:phospholipase C type enzyme [Tulasnella sp. 425]